MIILKLFARKDYENLNDYKKSLLKEERSRLAKKLLKDREKAKKIFRRLRRKSRIFKSGRFKKICFWR